MDPDFITFHFIQPDGSKSNETFTYSKHVLSKISPVIKNMLSSSMKESKTMTIETKFPKDELISFFGVLDSVLFDSEYTLKDINSTHLQIASYYQIGKMMTYYYSVLKKADPKELAALLSAESVIFPDEELCKLISRALGHPVKCNVPDHVLLDIQDHIINSIPKNKVSAIKKAFIEKLASFLSLVAHNSSIREVSKDVYGMCASMINDAKILVKDDGGADLHIGCILESIKGMEVNLCEALIRL